MFYEGYDDGDITALGTIWTFNTVASNTVNKHQSNGFPTNAKSLFTSGYATSPAFTTDHRWVHAWAQSNGGNGLYLAFLRNGSNAMTIFFQLATNTVLIRRGNVDGTVLASSAVINPNVPHLFWVYADVRNVAGDVRVYMDLSVTPLVQYQGDTTDAALDDFNQVQIGGHFATAYFDDIAVLTDAEKQQIFSIGAGVANPPTQELFCAAFAPSGNGTVQLTPSAGTNWQNVDERPFNTADYNQGTAVGQYDLFTYAEPKKPNEPF